MTPALFRSASRPPNTLQSSSFIFVAARRTESKDARSTGTFCTIVPCPVELACAIAASRAPDSSARSDGRLSSSTSAAPRSMAACAAKNPVPDVVPVMA